MPTTKEQAAEAFHKACQHAVSLGYPDIRSIGYKLTFNRRTRAVGLCDYKKMEIQLSVHFMQTNEVDVLYNTLLHEVAHALTPRNGHGARWKRVFLHLGGTGERLNRIVNGVAVKPKWKVVHMGTGEVVAEYMRKPRKDFSRCYIEGDESSEGNLKLIAVR